MEIGNVGFDMVHKVMSYCCIALSLHSVYAAIES
jgi:hypothetical protein